MVLGVGKGVLFREVSLSGVWNRNHPLYQYIVCMLYITFQFDVGNSGYDVVVHM